MTNEEARQWFLKVYSEIKGQGYVDENEEAYELAIKALEQKPILDKIRAEIEAEITHNLSDDQTQAFAYVLQIIDNAEKDNCKHNCEECEHNDGECCRILFERSFEQEPTSVKHDTFPVKLQINKVYKHISNIDLDELEQEPIDTVSRGVFEQIKWERDIAIEQLHELGYELGQKIEPCDDVVSRQSAIFLASDLKHDLPDDESIADMVVAHNEAILEYQTQLSLLPSVRPQEPTTRQSCENCKQDPKECGNDAHYGFCPNWENAE